MNDTAALPPERNRPGHKRSFALYVVSGFAATGTHYAFTVLVVEAFGWRPLVATSVGFLVGAITKYFLNYFLAFESDQPHLATIPRFAVMLGGLFSANAAIFWALHDQAGLHYMLAQVITTGLLVPVGYVINRIWVFR
jgi:putative flippase GtrA